MVPHSFHRPHHAVPGPAAPQRGPASVLPVDLELLAHPLRKALPPSTSPHLSCDPSDSSKPRPTFSCAICR
ncbi:hypothetical protein SBV1_820032 [Verrucomicrobia bacterium]|nr:hypothetical protein SBV1_820032 [Verrucomicrobiota bacterium]